MRCIRRVDIRHIGLFKVMRMRSAGKGGRSPAYQTAWGLRATLGDFTERVLTPERSAGSLDEEYAAYTRFGHFLARWAQTPFFDETEKVLADYSPSPARAASVATDRDSGIPARIRLYPADGFEGRHFAESFHAGDARDLDGSWPPDGSVGIAVSAPPLGWRKAAGLVLGGLTAPAMVAGTVVGWRLMFADLWNGKAEGLDGFIMGSGAVITVLVMGLFSLIAGVWWLTALAAATSRARLLLTPDVLLLKTKWPGTAAYPRATIQTVRLAQCGHTRIGDERVSVDWRLFLLLENGRELSLLPCERDAALAEWLKNRIEQWIAA